MKNKNVSEMRKHLLSNLAAKMKMLAARRDRMTQEEFLIEKCELYQKFMHSAIPYLTNDDFSDYVLNLGFQADALMQTAIQGSMREQEEWVDSYLWNACMAAKPHSAVADQMVAAARWRH